MPQSDIRCHQADGSLVCEGVCLRLNTASEYGDCDCVWRFNWLEIVERHIHKILPFRIKQANQGNGAVFDEQIGRSAAEWLASG